MLCAKSVLVAYRKCAKRNSIDSTYQHYQMKNLMTIIRVTRFVFNYSISILLTKI